MEFKVKLNLSVLLSSIGRLGIETKGIDGIETAVKVIYRAFKDDEIELNFVCDKCGAEIPDLDFCPFCGVEYTETGVNESSIHGILAAFYRGAKRGRKGKLEERESGASLFNKVVEELGIPSKWIKYRSSVTSFWCEWGLFAKLYIGTYSVRIEIPLDITRYDEDKDIVVPFDEPYKNMKCRLTVECLGDIVPAVSILSQTVIQKKVDSDEKERRKKGGSVTVERTKKKMGRPLGKTNKPKPPSRPKPPTRPVVNKQHGE